MPYLVVIWRSTYRMHRPGVRLFLVSTSPEGQLWWQCRDFWGFLGISRFPILIPKTFSIFNSPYVNFIFSLINFMSSFTSSMLRKIVCSAQHRCIIMPVSLGAKRGVHYVLLHWTLSLSEHRKVAFISSILNIEVSTIDFLGLSA